MANETAQAARAALDEAKTFTRPLLDSVVALNMPDREKLSQHIRAVRDDYQRQLEEAAAAAPDHLKS